MKHKYLIALAISTMVPLTVTLSTPAWAGLEDISNQDAAKGVKETLQRGADIAIQSLGKQDGFLGNPKVRIPLPDTLQNMRGALKMFGKEKQADELEVSINRAAEAAVPEAKALLQNAIKTMTVQDAKQILTGGDNSVTEFFRAKTQTSLQAKFLPIVKKTTDKAGLAQQYNQLAGKGAEMGLIKGNQTTVESYVTQKALDGLYAMIAEEEKSIRANPMQAGSKLLQSIFSK